VIDAETAPGTEPIPAVVAYGGQTPLNLAGPLARGGVPLLGSNLEAIDQAEERTRFSALLDRLGIPQPEGGMAHSVEEALTLAERIGYPVIVRPSFVIGGLAIDFCYSPTTSPASSRGDRCRPGPPGTDRPLSRGGRGRCRRRVDGERVLIPGLLEHVERAGVHSGDSVGMFPPQTVGEGDQALIVSTMERIVLALGATGPRQRPVHRPRRRRLPDRGQPARLADRAVPVEGHRRADGRPGRPDLARGDASGAGLGRRPARPAAVRRGQGAGLLDGQAPWRRPVVGPGMQSTGEVIGIHVDPRVALAKALLGAALVPPRPAAGGGPRAAVDRRPGTRARSGGWPARSAAGGYRFAATPGTRRAVAAAGYEARPVAKLGARAGRGDRRGRESSRRSPTAASGSSSTPRRRARASSATRRDPPRRDGGGDPLPDRDRDRDRRR
jgi:carbamoyl-phosphate synthase large subunit